MRTQGGVGCGWGGGVEGAAAGQRRGGRRMPGNAQSTCWDWGRIIYWCNWGSGFGVGKEGGCGAVDDRVWGGVGEMTVLSRAWGAVSGRARVGFSQSDMPQHRMHSQHAHKRNVCQILLSE